MATSSTLIQRGGRATGIKRLCLALLLAGGIAAPLAQQARASADTYNPDVLCRSDPVIVVDGAIVDVVSTIQSDPSAIQKIDYQLTVPSGALVGKITLTVGLGVPENVTYVYSPSQPWGSVQVTATVVPQNGVTSIPVSVQVSSLLAGSATASGSSDAPLMVTLDHILML